MDLERDATPLARLCRYYLACLEKDLDRDLREVAASSDALPRYAELPAMPLVGRESATIWAGEDAGRVLQRHRLEKRRLSLVFGYPTRLEFVRTRAGWEGFLVEPLFIFELRADAGARHPKVTPGPPEFNLRALRALSGREGMDLLDELMLLRRELGMDPSAYTPEELGELFGALRRVRPDWAWREPIRPEALTREPPLAAITQEGIYNRAILMTAARTPDAQRLVSDLRALERLRTSDCEGTALGQWLGTSAGEGDAGQARLPLIEVLPLNSEQRLAVESAMSRPLTVLTGPPGTGKSQVVTAIVVNGAWRGQKVLFASKNPRAVEVVEARVNALGPRAAVLRLGPEQVQTRLAESLAGLLASTTLDREQQEYREVEGRHRVLLGRRDEILAELRTILELRNTVDALERDVEQFRALFPKGLGGLADVEVEALERAIGRAERVVSRSVRTHGGIVERARWTFVGRKRLGEALAACEEVESAGGVMGLGRVSDLDLNGEGAALEAYLREARKRREATLHVQRYLAAVDRLRAQGGPERITARMLELEAELGDVCVALWRLWLRLHPARLTRAQRTLLGDYKSLLEIVAQAEEADERPDAKVLERFYELFPRITEVLPAWCVTSVNAGGWMPLEAGLFDLLVVDEAAQCDIASVLPLLYRAKRAVIVGDSGQLRHVSRMGSQVNQQLVREHGLSQLGERWSYTENSVFDLAASLTESGDVINLRDHHRSREEVIGFSNEHVYRGYMRIATRDTWRGGPAGESGVRWVQTSGAVRRPAEGGALNEDEARAVVDELERLLVEQRYAGSVGVVSPFRSQVDLIRALARERSSLAGLMARQGVQIDTAYAFQGDEREVMIVSPVVSEGTPRTALEYLATNTNPLNVALTRARGGMIVVGDLEACARCGVDYLGAFARYVQDLEAARTTIAEGTRDLGPEYPSVAHPARVSEWERVLYRALYRAGVRPIPQHPVEQYLLDLGVIEGDRRLAIEVDVEKYHHTWDGDMAMRDQLRNRRLIELGWDIVRFWVYQVRDDTDGCVRRVLAWREGREPEGVVRVRRDVLERARART